MTPGRSSRRRASQRAVKQEVKEEQPDWEREAEEGSDDAGSELEDVVVLEDELEPDFVVLEDELFARGGEATGGPGEEGGQRPGRGVGGAEGASDGRRRQGCRRLCDSSLQTLASQTLLNASTLIMSVCQCFCFCRCSCR